MAKRRPLLTEPQLRTLINVFIAAGQITSGSIAAPYVFPLVDKPPIGILFFGLASTIILWVAPVILARRLKS